jgi:dGTPase
VITRFIEDVIDESRRRIAETNLTTARQAREAGRASIGFSPGMAGADRDVKTFLFSHMYRHPEVRRVREKAEEMVRSLFQAYVAAPDAMPAEWAARASEGMAQRAAADYIAGMTDRFAVGEFRRLFDPGANLR